ncbi:hypothetical protein U4Z66_24145, partial [Escherichia coli]|nr:hypothetical protein [Escherichia coli]
ADRNRSHWSTSKTPSYTKSVSWQHYRHNMPLLMLCSLTEVIMDFRLLRKKGVKRRGFLRFWQ